MVLEIRSVNFRNLATQTFKNNKCRFSVKKYIYACCYLPEDMFHPMQDIRYPRISRKGINFKKIQNRHTLCKTYSKGMKVNAKPNYKKQRHQQIFIQKTAYFKILDEQVKGSKINGNIFQRAAERIRLANKRIISYNVVIVLLPLIFSW